MGNNGIRKQQPFSTELVRCSGTCQTSLCYLFMVFKSRVGMQSRSADLQSGDGLHTFLQSLPHLQQHEPALNGEQQPRCRLPTLQSLCSPEMMDWVSLHHWPQMC